MLARLAMISIVVSFVCGSGRVKVVMQTEWLAIDLPLVWR